MTHVLDLCPEMELATPQLNAVHGKGPRQEHVPVDLEYAVSVSSNLFFFSNDSTFFHDNCVFS